MNELKYPIKYAIMPIMERNRYDDNVLLFNIVSKCYVVSKRTDYKSNGTSKKIFEVVFPYQNTGYYGKLEKNIPKYDLYHRYYNSLEVDEIFDTFENALAVSNIKNNELLGLNLAYSSLRDTKKVIEMHQEMINKYKIMEREIEDKTKDVIITTESISKVKKLK